MDAYLTLAQASSCEYTVNKSRFIGSVSPVSSAEQAVNFVNKIKGRYPDAKHNVYAYRLRAPEYSRYSDDGEPQGTAGMPVLAVIKKNGITDVCIVVTRYFGGILLGTGGLVRAYSHTASLAVESAGIAKTVLCGVFEVICGYGFYEGLSSLIASHGGIAESVGFTEKVRVVFRLPSDMEADFLVALTGLSSGRVSAKKIGEKFDGIS